MKKFLWHWGKVFCISLLILVTVGLILAASYAVILAVADAFGIYGFGSLVVLSATMYVVNDHLRIKTIKGGDYAGPR